MFILPKLSFSQNSQILFLSIKSARQNPSSLNKSQNYRIYLLSNFFLAKQSLQLYFDQLIDSSNNPSIDIPSIFFYSPQITTIYYLQT